MVWTVVQHLKVNIYGYAQISVFDTFIFSFFELICSLCYKRIIVCCKFETERESLYARPTWQIVL